MQQRYVSIWFRHLITDWFTLQHPRLKNIPFVIRTPVHGRMVITAANALAEAHGVTRGMVLADARACIPGLEAHDDLPELAEKLLKRLAEWCIRFTPMVAIDLPDGLIFDATGCAHLWGGEENYLATIIKKLAARGYDVRASIANTISLSWGVARFGEKTLIIPQDKQVDALLPLPPEALRFEEDVITRLHKLGLHKVRQFINIPRSSLRRRFGQAFIMRLDMALGQEMEIFHPVQPLEPYQERLPCMEPIVTAIGIEIALNQLLKMLCLRLQQEQKGLRTANLKCYRVDGKVEQISIGTNRPTHHVHHLFKLFEPQLSTIEPALGIELFVLQASKVEDHFAQQEKMWMGPGSLEDPRLSELLDRLTNKIGMHSIHRYLPDEHYWPERSVRKATSLDEKTTVSWRKDKLRPLQLLPRPERIEVTAPIPDYPPMSFRYKGKLYTITKADGPERIEQEWWIQQGQHRDYYQVEDDAGHRYWLFRSGNYDDKESHWFLHGFFA